MVRTRGRTGAWIALGLIAAGAGGTVAYLALRKSEDLPGTLPAPSPQPILPGEPSPTGSTEPASQAGDIKDASLILVLEQLAPGAAESISLIRKWLDAEPAQSRRVVNRYESVVQAYLSQFAAQRALTAQWREQASQIAAGIKVADAAFDAIGKIPFIGQVLQGVYQIARMFAQAEAEAVANGRTSAWGGFIIVGTPNFIGWLATDPATLPEEAPWVLKNPADPFYFDGTYWALNLPVMSFMAPIQIASYLATTGEVYGPALRKLRELAVARPFGVDVPRVDTTQTGQYSYKFNADGNNDLSDAAQAAGKIFWVDVWDPSDISAKGPKGFDPANPRGWYQRAWNEAHPIHVSSGPASSY